MMPKFIATDLDGTFLNDQKQYNRDVFAAVLNAYTELGGQFIVASGRDRRHIEMLFGGFLDKVNIISDNGATITAADGSFVERTVMTVQALAGLQAEIDRMPVKPHGGVMIFTPEALYKVAGYGTVPEKFESMMGNLYGDVTAVDSLRDITAPVLKVTVFWALDEAERFIAQVNASKVNVHPTTPGHGVVDVMPSGINKAVSLQRLVTHLGGSLDDLAVFGDGMNDLEMLAKAGQSVIMPNADDRLKAYGYRVALADNNHDGVLETWRRMLSE